MHFAGEDGFVPQTAVDAITSHFAEQPEVRIHVYPGVDHAFYNHDRSEVYHRPSAMVAHSRTIALLRAAIGPAYDLEKLWERHLDYEFTTRDTDKTMATWWPSPTSTTSRP